jgi:hypothetical protein
MRYRFLSVVALFVIGSFALSTETGCSSPNEGGSFNAASESAADVTGRGEGWGTIKGQVVWGDDKPPKLVKITPDKDREECEKNGPLHDERLEVNQKNKGVKSCFVYLVSAKGGVKGFAEDIPVHPKLREVSKKPVELDQPCCQFIPHIVTLREGQTLLVKNSSEASHNVNIIGGTKNPSINQILPKKTSFEMKGFKAYHIPIEVKCDIHSWMHGRIAVMKHPYFAVTDEDGNFEIKDAPAGEFRIVVWHEEVGWVLGENDKAPTRDGKKITIKAGETTDIGKVPMKK